MNKKHQLKSSLIFDEFPTIYFNGIDNLMATARANRVATTLAVQDYSQLKKDYGKDQAEVIMNIVGNVISGQVVGETDISRFQVFPFRQKSADRERRYLRLEILYPI